MASFVAEVLSSAGQMEREEINERLSLLARRMEELKADIHTAITTSFTHFDSSFDTTTTLSEKVKALSEEMESLSLKINSEVKGQLSISTGDFQGLSRQLGQVTAVMGLLEKLSQAQQLLENIAQATASGKFLSAASSLQVLEEALSNPLCEREEEIKILVSLRTEQKVLKQKLIQQLNDTWKGMVGWSQVENMQKTNTADQLVDTVNKRDTDFELRQCELRLPKSSEVEQQIIQEVVLALESLGQLDRKIQTFGRQFLEYVILALVLRWQKVEVTEAIVGQVKQVTFKAASLQKQPVHMNVFSLMESILDMLNENLLHIKVVRHSSTDSAKVEVTLMNLLGEEIGERVLQGIVKECLSSAIPSTSKELEGFHEVVAITKKFQERLVALGFIDASSQTLLDYVQNVNVLFANKKCQGILEQARSLMTSDLHDTVQVHAGASGGELPPLDKSGGPSREKLRKMAAGIDPLLSSSCFRMPSCRISARVKELMDLAYSTLSEACTSSPQCAAQMFYAVRGIFELYCSVVPTYHAHSIANFPQLAALHHNNCMYLAHHLLTLGHQFQSSLPEGVNSTFVDIIPEVRALGATSFLEQMNTQKTIIEQYLQGAAGFVGLEEEKNHSCAAKAVKQALHQLTHLQKIWLDILPISVYCKAIGILFNSFISDVINHITVLEDISTDAARRLVLLTKQIDDRGTTLFSTSSQETEDDIKRSAIAKAELHRHVSLWSKFMELQLVLSSSLQEISDRWSDGKGPLASEFSPSEIKQLIRALFQNTDRRAAVLAKIK